jgi:hypothetical protein
MPAVTKVDFFHHDTPFIQKEWAKRGFAALPTLLFCAGKRITF